ncbi:MAG: flagellar basal body-associated FliL family protein [Armatimonadetes bacterium]|nr:flagellar basal body-associated FliL family protein [Armatimonadota bacterium]
MSDKAAEKAPAEEGKKKKGGKLPLIIGLVVLLAGGGFFMKSRGGKKEVPAIKLAKMESMIDLKEEFLVNLAGGEHYLKAKIQLLPSDKAKKEELEHAAPAIMDVIYSRLRKTTLKQVNSPKGFQLLKRQLAIDINWAVESLEPKDEHKDEKKKDEKGKKEEHAKDESAGPEELTQLPDPTELQHPDWDNEEGPILKIFFTSFATQ